MPCDQAYGSRRKGRNHSSTILGAMSATRNISHKLITSLIKDEHPEARWIFSLG